MLQSAGAILTELPPLICDELMDAVEEFHRARMWEAITALLEATRDAVGAKLLGGLPEGAVADLVR